jgi:hypothetical protein
MIAAAAGGTVALVAGVSRIGGRACDSAGNCLHGDPVTAFGVTLIVLGCLLLAGSGSAALVTLSARHRRTAYRVGIWLLRLLPITLILVLLAGLLASPSLNR